MRERESRHFNDESTSTRGPIMDYKDKELVQYYFDQLKKLAKKDHCIFIKFDPAVHVNDYDSKSYNINRYKETELYLDTFKSRYI